MTTPPPQGEDKPLTALARRALAALLASAQLATGSMAIALDMQWAAASMSARLAPALALAARMSERMSLLSWQTTLGLLPILAAHKAAAQTSPPPPPPAGVSESEGVGNYATEGQALGAELLRGAATQNASRAARTGSPSATQETGNNDFFMREYIPGAANSFSRLQNLGRNPDGMQAAAMQARQNAFANGCTTTHFFQNETGRKVLDVEVFRVYLDPVLDGNGQPTGRRTERLVPASDVVFNVPMRWRALGGNTTKRIDVSNATDSVPGVRAIITNTPYYAPLDGSHFAYNIRISEGSGTIMDHGALANGYTPTGLLATVNGRAAATADLYVVERNYFQPPGTGCPADPPACNLDGVDFCSAPNTGIYPDLWAKRPVLTDAFGVLRDSVAAPHVSNMDTNVQAVMSRSRAVIDGNDAIWRETFTGCEVTAATAPGQTITRHLPDLYTCNDVRVKPDANTCDGQRQLGFSSLGRDQNAMRIRFFRAVQVPIPNTNPVQYTTEIRPLIYSGPVNVNFSLIGQPGYLTGAQGPDGGYAQYEFYRVPEDPNTTFPYNIRFVSVNGGSVSGAVRSIGDADNQWTLDAEVAVDSATEMYVVADFYQMMRNEITGCDNYFKAVGDAFCTAPLMNCTDMRGPCTTVDGVTFCDDQGNGTYGIAKLLTIWGAKDSAQEDPNDPTRLLPGGGPIELAPRMCWAAHGSELDCSRMTQGFGGCYVDANGTTQCIDVDGTTWSSHFGDPKYVDDCALRENARAETLWNNPRCRLMDRFSCMPGQLGLFSGQCYTRTVTYDCGEDFTVTLPGGASMTQSCGGPIRCMGTQCHNVAGEANADFAEMAARLQAAEMAQNDVGCIEYDGKLPPTAQSQCTLRVFGGKHFQCKIALGSPGSTGGLGVDCCAQGDQAAVNVDVGGYLQLLMYSLRLMKDPTFAAMLAELPGMTSLMTSFSQFGGSLQSALSSVTGPISNAFGNFATQFGFSATTPGAVQLASDAISMSLDITQGAVAAGGQSMVGGIYAEAIVWILKQLGLDSAAAAVSAALSGTGSGVLGQALQYMNTIFMIYMIIKILMQLIFKCEKDELQLGIERKVGNCVYIGEYRKSRWSIVKLRSFCCYTSPLSRIIAEQLRNPPTGTPPGQNIGGGYGNVREPNCTGFSEEELNQVDWSRVDLSEWLVRLQQSGLLPTNDTKAEEMYGPQSKRLPARIGKDAPGPFGNIGAKEATASWMNQLGGGGTLTDFGKMLEPEPVCYSNPALMPWYNREVKPEDIIVMVGGTGRAESCGDGCIEVTLGSEVDNNLPGNECTIPHRQFYDLNVYRPDLIIKAELVDGYWDDKMQITFNDRVVFQSDNWNLPRCEYFTTWCFGTLSNPGFCQWFWPPPDTRYYVDGLPTWVFQNQTVDVTDAMRQQGSVRISTNVKAGGMGEGFAKMRIYYQSNPNQNGGVDCIAPASYGWRSQ